MERSSVPFPGKHPHAFQLASLLFLLEVFGFLALILSSIIVINLISAMIVQHTRQIGVMKAIGARTSQIMALYLGNVGLLGVIALFIAIPASIVFARTYAGFAANMLNFTILDDSVPLPVFLVICGIGLLLPILSALLPVYQGSRMTVRAAMNNYGISQGKFAIKHFYVLLSKISWLPRPLILAIRNTFRKHGRVVLTLATLAIGGAMFMASFNIGASITRTIEVIGKTLPYDLELSLERPVARDTIANILANIPSVKDFEGWGEARGMIVHADGSSGMSFPIIAPIAQTKLFKPQIVAGRWLSWPL